MKSKIVVCGLAALASAPAMAAASFAWPPGPSFWGFFMQIFGG